MCDHKCLPQFERFLAVEPIDKIVAPIYRSRDMLPKWFAMFEELHSNKRLQPQLRQICYRVSPCLSISTEPDQAQKVPFDSSKVDNRQTVASILTESANVARAASSSVIPTDRLHLLTAPITTIVSHDVNNMPSSHVTSQSSLSSNTVASTNAAHSNIFVIAGGRVQQLDVSASVLPMLTTCTGNQISTVTPGLPSRKSEIWDNESVALVGSECGFNVPASDNVNKSTTTAVTSSPNLIGQAFASAVGITIDQLSSYADVEPGDDDWNFPAPASSRVAIAASSVPGDVTCSISSNTIPVYGLEQSATASVPDVSVSSSCDDLSLTGPESKNIFARYDDVSALDITMLNNSLSPSPPSEVCDHHMNTDSTLATPKKMEYNRNDETLTFTRAKIHASDDAQMSPCGTGLPGVTGKQYPVSCKCSEVEISGVTCASSVKFNTVTTTVYSGGVVSTVPGSNSIPSVNSAPVRSSAHGMSLLSCISGEMSVISSSADSRPSSVISLSSMTPLSAGSAASLPLSSPCHTKQIPMHHKRSASKCVPSNQRPILPRGEQPVSSKSVSSFLSKPKPKKSTGKVKALPAIAPKAAVTQSYPSPVKQAAASIRARVKRLQNSPSRNVWCTSPRFKTVESPSCSVSHAARAPVVWTLASDDAASGDDDEHNTDVDSQLEDELEEDLSAPSTEQSPVYVELWALSSAIYHINKIKPTAWLVTFIDIDLMA